MKRHTDLNDFAEALIKGNSQSSPLLLGVFLCGILAVTLFGNWLYDFSAASLEAPLRSSLLVLGLAGLCVLVGYLLWRRFLGGLSIDAQVTEQSAVEPHRGLVWLLSPGAIEHLLFAVRQHLPRLLRVWIIMTGDPAVQQRLGEFRATVVKEGWSVAVEPVEIEQPDLACTLAAVEAIYQERVPAAGLAPEDVIADITGGLKPMTSGMTLACYVHGWPLEYVSASRDFRGEPRSGGDKVLVSVNIDTNLIHRADSHD